MTYVYVALAAVLFGAGYYVGYKFGYKAAAAEKAVASIVKRVL